MTSPNGFLRKNAHRFYARLIQPRAHTEDLQRREYILNVVLISSIAMLVLLDASIIYHFIGMGPRYNDVSPITFSLIPLFFIFLHALSRRGFFIPASYLTIAAYFASVSYAVYRYGVYLPTGLLGYAMVIIISGILISTRFGLFLTVLTTAFITPLWYMQVHGMIAFQKQNIDGSDGIVFGALYAVIMAVTWLSNREIERSLARARRSEAELKKERDSLEVTVEQRTRELREAQFEKMEQLYRFAELGRLSSGLFHDILNMLNALSLRIENQESFIEKNDVQRAALNRASETTKQIDDLTKAIRNQLNDAKSKEIFSLNEGIRQAIQLVLYKANKEGVRISFDRSNGDDIHCYGNPFKFHQILINLILNAIQSYESVPKDERQRGVIIRLEEQKGMATLQIKDNGCGIPQAIQAKIFEPFFTTKIKNQGMGIGLASTKKIVEEDFRGTIAVQSQEQKGSTFVVRFPLQ